MSRALVLAVAFSVAAVAGCASTPQFDAVTAAQQAEVAAYAAEEVACVATSATAVEARDCIDDVQIRWCSLGQPLALIGACGDSGLSTKATIDAMHSVDVSIAVKNAVFAPVVTLPADGGHE